MIHIPQGHGAPCPCGMCPHLLLHMDYPKHLYDPDRRAIAVRYVRHEFRKLFPGLRDEEAWKTIDASIAGWFDANPTLAPVRDFWNGLHGISMGFKLKNLVSWLTSVNMAWSERAVPVDELSFGAILDETECVGHRPSAQDVRTWYFNPERAETLAVARAAHEERSKMTMPRDEFPIIVMRKEGVLRVVDGNRRVLRAILFEQPTINAVIGEQAAEPAIHESWVPTSTLIDLVSFHRYWSSQDRDVTNPVATVITELLRDSSAGRYEFTHRALSTEAEADQTLFAAVKTRLEKSGVKI